MSRAKGQSAYNAKAVAALQTTTERIVDRLFQSLARPANEADLVQRIRKARYGAVASSFGRKDDLYLDVGVEFDRIITAARLELGIPSPTMSDHLERLQGNGPWLVDANIPPSTSWDTFETKPGVFACVNHEHRLLSSANFRSPEKALENLLRSDEGALRKFRRLYEETFPPEQEPLPAQTAIPEHG